MLGLGLFVCVVSMVRTHTRSGFSASILWRLKLNKMLTLPLEIPLNEFMRSSDRELQPKVQNIAMEKCCEDFGSDFHGLTIDYSVPSSVNITN